MAYVIIKGCIECGRCLRECPEEAIYRAKGTYAIDPNKCIDCGICADECPLELILPDYEVESE